MLLYAHLLNGAIAQLLRRILPSGIRPPHTGGVLIAPKKSVVIKRGGGKHVVDDHLVDVPFKLAGVSVIL